MSDQTAINWETIMRTMDETNHINWRHHFNEEEKEILNLAQISQVGIYGVIGKLERLLDVIQESIVFNEGAKAK